MDALSIRDLWVLVFALFFGSGVLLGCDSSGSSSSADPSPVDSSPSSPDADDSAPPASSGVGFTALVDGVRYDATELFFAGIDGSRTLAIVSANADFTMELHMDGDTTGGYVIDSASDNEGYYSDRNTQEIFSSGFGGTGTITLTTLTANRMAGRFEFTAGPLLPTTPNKVTVTEGTFDVARTD